MTEKRFMVSPKVAAEMLEVSRESVLRLIRRGKLPASKVSPATIRIRVADLEAFMERQRV